MNATLLLPWFPIVLSVAVAGRLLGRGRGLGVGFVCALFWVALVQAAAGVVIWQSGWTVMSLIAGSLAIVFMGGWSGQDAVPLGSTARSQLDATGPSHNDVRDEGALGRLALAMNQFDEWRSDHRDHPDSWPAFGEFVRRVLYEACAASHVQLYSLRSGEDELVALHAAGSTYEGDRRSARHGIPGHVATTGRTYVAGDATQGALVHELATQAGERIAWCFPITSGERRLGVVVVGRIGIAPETHRTLMRATEQLVTQFWCRHIESLQNRSNAQRDPVSGLLTRPAFLRSAETVLRESYRQGEPVALVVASVEGLRDLGDKGRWEQADEIASDVARALRDKLRTDDCIGRFDGSSFVLLLRRVDSELAALIVGQLLSRLSAIQERASSAEAAIRVRCCVVGSGTDQPDLRSLVSRALLLGRRARETNESIITDLPERKSKRPVSDRPGSVPSANRTVGASGKTGPMASDPAIEAQEPAPVKRGAK